MKAIVEINGTKVTVRHNGEILLAICQQLNLKYVAGGWTSSTEGFIKTDSSYYYVWLRRNYLRA